jgi:hypothetical protein
MADQVSEHPTDRSPPPSEEPTDRGGSTHGIPLTELDSDAHLAHHAVLAAKAARVIEALPQLRDDLIRMIDDRFRVLLADLGVADSSMVVHEVHVHGAALAALRTDVDGLPCRAGGGCDVAAE